MGNALFSFASLRNSVFIASSRFGSLAGEVLSLREVRLEVVEFPNVLARIPGGEPWAHREPRRQRAEGAGEPPVLIDAAAAVVVEILDVLSPRRLRVGEGVDHAGPVDWVLLEAVDDLGRLDAEDLVDRRRDVVDVVELRPRRLVRLDTRRPRDGQRIAGAAEMRGDQLGVMERRAACPRPAGVIHVVHLGPAERVEAADPVQGIELLIDGVGNLVLRQQLADGAVLALGARTVVSEDVEHDGVVADAEAVEFVDHLADLGIDMFDEPGEHLHQPALEGALGVPGCCPTRPWLRRAA